MSNIQHPTRTEHILFAEHERLWELAKDLYEYSEDSMSEIFYQMLATIVLTENILKRFNRGDKNEQEIQQS